MSLTTSDYEQFLGRLADAIGCESNMQSIAIAVGELRAKANRLATMRAVIKRVLDTLPSPTDVDDLRRGIDTSTDVQEAVRNARHFLAKLLLED